jgi:hypothetical protein
MGYGHNQLFRSSVTAIAQESSTTVQAIPSIPSSRNNRHLILFNVAPCHFCAPAAEVESMIMVPPVSRLPLAPAALDEIVHHVVPGDTLWDIAAHYLDAPFQYPELARLSQISSPDLIYPGDIIHIIRKER